MNKHQKYLPGLTKDLFSMYNFTCLVRFASAPPVIDCLTPFSKNGFKKEDVFSHTLSLLCTTRATKNPFSNRYLFCSKKTYIFVTILWTAKVSCFSDATAHFNGHSCSRRHRLPKAFVFHIFFHVIYWTLYYTECIHCHKMVIFVTVRS